jgi:hypothetical protein
MVRVDGECDVSVKGNAEDSGTREHTCRLIPLDQNVRAMKRISRQSAISVPASHHQRLLKAQTNKS